ncbi:MAG: hypothetical protein RLZZ214_1528, partial [Verrucomicrobiota bacterium]
FDILNEHYPAAAPNTTIAGAEALLTNHYSRGKILSLDETNTETEPQTRLEAWMFFIGGGGVYDGLDYTGLVYTEATPSGDNPLGNAIRGAVRNSWTYMNQLHLTKLRRNLAWVTGGQPGGSTLQASASIGQQYVAYLHHGQKGTTSFQLNYNPIINSSQTVALNVTLPAGTWRAVWTRPSNFTELSVQVLNHAGGSVTLAPVTYQTDVALRIDRTGAGDTTPPPPPATTAAVSNDDGSISLSWNAVQAFDLGGYRVYRAETPVVPIDSIHRIAALPATITDFKDASAVFGRTYFYAVTAVDLLENESSASPEVQATSTPAYPALNVSESSAGQITVQWATTSPGWYLQENNSLSPDSWTYSSLVPSVVGENYQVTVAPSPQRRFFRLTHQPPTPPEIRFFSDVQGGFFLEWSALSEGWYLQESANVSPDSWTYSPLVPVLVGENYQVSYTPSPQRRFFRLVWIPPPAAIVEVIPALQLILSEAGQYLLDWPAPSTGWHLQESPDLAPDSWEDSTRIPVLVGDHFQVSIAATAPRRFFRLIRP